MKLTFILFAFILNFFKPYFLKAEEMIDLSNNQIENTAMEGISSDKDSKFKKIHIVQIGDTITRISNLYSIEKDLIIKLNDLKDENYIYVGQNLRISDSIQEGKNEKDANNYHIVQKGESLTEISTKYNLNFKKLIEINNLKNPDSLEIGSKIFLSYKDTSNQDPSKIIADKAFNKLTIENYKTYGPIKTKQNKLEEVNNRKTLNVLNKNNKKLIISVRCQTKDLDVRIPGRKWRGWISAEEEFEKKLINDFC